MPRPRRVERVIARRGALVAERDPLRPSGRLLLQDGMDASYVDLADPSHLEFDYLRWIRIVVRAARARRVLHLGGGACSLARALAAETPDGLQEVAEVDADVLALAREHLGLRRGPGLRVRHADGRELLARQPDASWDAIVVDAFIGASPPHALVTVEALADAARVAPLTLVNVIDDRMARDVRAIAAAAAPSYPYVWTLGARTGNTVVIGCTRRLDLDAIAGRVAADPSPARVTAPEALAARLPGTVALRDGDRLPRH